jgi:hypothetical protein
MHDKCVELKEARGRTVKKMTVALLSSVSMSAIRSALGVSKWYASKIRKGYRPHPRHWESLGQLVGVKSPNDARHRQ